MVTIRLERRLSTLILPADETWTILITFIKIKSKQLLLLNFFFPFFIMFFLWWRIIFTILHRKTNIINLIWSISINKLMHKFNSRTLHLPLNFELFILVFLLFNCLKGSNFSLFDGTTGRIEKEAQEQLAHWCMYMYFVLNSECVWKKKKTKPFHCCCCRWWWWCRTTWSLDGVYFTPVQHFATVYLSWRRETHTHSRHEWG